MARETALWQRCKTGLKFLRSLGHEHHFCRIENDAGDGNPDVEGCINGDHCQIELKSCDRPARPSTPIHPKTRLSQSVWHKLRTRAGGRIHWVLIQVGENRAAKLYLIPGSFYDDVHIPEEELERLAVNDPDEAMASILIRACEGW
jgi:hypothetical protein